jgi:hypothetical protein
MNEPIPLWVSRAWNHDPTNAASPSGFELWPEAQGRSLARKAAGAGLRFGHEQANLRRFVAVARDNYFVPRMVFGGIGMTKCASFSGAGDGVVREPHYPAWATCWRIALINASILLLLRLK